MDNRSEFLNNVAQALGRPLRLEPQAGESFRSWFKKHQAQEKKNG